MANFQLQDVQKVPYTLAALDADGNPTALATGGTVAVASSDVAMATVVPDTAPTAGVLASGFIVGGAKLGTVQINATATNADGTAGPTGAVAIDIVAGPAATIAMNLGTPVAQ